MSSDGQERSTTSRESAAAEADALWQRWTGELGPFYHACAVVGFDPASDRDLDAGPGIEKPEIEFTTGVVRRGLRNIPVLMLLAASLAFLVEQLNDFYTPIGTYFPDAVASVTFDPLYLFGVPVLLLWGALLARIFRGSVSTDNLRIHRSVFFYGTLGVLLAGVAYSVYLVVSGRLADTGQHLAFRSGYFLFLFIEGHLAYDGLVLRSENLFWNLRDSTTVDGDAYEAFRQQLAENLGPVEFGPYSAPFVGGSLGPVSVSPGLLFAAVLLGPITPLPMLGYDSSTSVLDVLGYGITVVMQVFLIAVLFQFVVVIWQFSKLLSGDYLDYKLFHPDEHGGYRALGRFATRVNVMLVVAGGYVAFRFLTGGLQQFGVMAGGSTLGLLTWIVSFVAPLVVYLAVALLWLYFSFWRMHRQMKRGRRKKIQQIQQHARGVDDRDTGTAGNEMEDLELDAPAWESLKNAPVWPIQRRSLFGIVALDAAPILVTVVL